MGFLALAAETYDFAKTSALTASSENPTFPAENIKSLPVGRRTRTQVGDVSGQTWTFDAGESKRLSLACIIGHNFTSTVIITLRAGDTSDCLDFTANIPYRLKAAFIIMQYAQSYRYWQIEVTDLANEVNYLAFGRVLLIEALQLRDFNFSYQWKRGHRFVNLTQTTPFGVNHVDKRYKVITLSLPFHEIPVSQSRILEDYVDALDGNGEVVFVIPDPSKYDGYLMRLQSDFDVMFPNYAYADIEGLSFVEEPYGLVLGA